MAVISKNKNASDSGSGNEESTLKTVDIFDKDLEGGKDVDMDSTSDAFDMPAPPPKGYYEVTLFADKDGFKTGLFDKDDDDSVYYSVGLECPISRPEKYEGVRIFGKCSTVVGRGKANSTMGTLITKCGGELPKRASHLEVARLFAKVLKKEPSLIVEIDWRAWDKEAGEFAIYGMENFPKREDGTYSNITEKKGKRLIGSAFPVRWFTKAEYKAGLASGQIKKLDGAVASTTGNTASKEEKKEAPKQQEKKKEERKEVTVVEMDDDFTFD